MNEPAVTYEREEHVGLITMNRPAERNTMTPELLDAFAAAVKKARQDSSVRCVIVTGKGECFCAGANLNAPLQRESRGHSSLPPDRSFAMYEPFLSVLRIEVPTVAALNGHAVGGGFGLALTCDIRVAARSGRYGANFVRLGLHPGMAVTYLLPRLAGVSQAAEMLFTGALITAEEGQRIGLWSHVVDAADVLERARHIANTIASNAPDAVRMTKRTLYRGLDWDAHDAAYLEAYAQAVTIATPDLEEGLRAVRERRPPRF